MIGRILSILISSLLVFTGCANVARQNQQPVDAGVAEETVLPADIEAEDDDAAQPGGGNQEEENGPTAPASSLNGKLICIDPGHCVYSKSYQEPMAPGSNMMKPAFVSGTEGATYTEEQINLMVGLKLEEKLLEKGAQVIMTRREAECELSNVGRAQFANDAGADLVVRLHADGSDNPAVSGMSMLIPTDDYISDEELIAKSRRAGEIILGQAALSTGAQNRGLSPRSDMTGFNWSTVPVVLLEMGFMTNSDEDALLSTEEYREKIVDGIVNGLELYFLEEEAK